MGFLRKISHSLKVKREPFHLDVSYMWSHVSKDQDESLRNYASALWSLALYNSHHRSSLSTTLIDLVSALGIGCMLTSLTPKGPIETSPIVVLRQEQPLPLFWNVVDNTVKVKGMITCYDAKEQIQLQPNTERWDFYIWTGNGRHSKLRRWCFPQEVCSGDCESAKVKGDTIRK